MNIMFFKPESYLKAGAPLEFPELLLHYLDITHPSLFDKIATGLPINFGLKTLSEA